ncbi:hypothetical protein [Arthrobacter sp. HLT1-20]
MELAQWTPWAVAGVAALALVWNAYQVLNRRAVAYTRASNLLGLAKTLSELDVAAMDKTEIEEGKILHQRSLEGGFFHTQLYIGPAIPWMTSHRISTVFFSGSFIALFTAPLQQPLTGSYDDDVSILASLLPGVLLLATSVFVYFRVDRNKMVLKQLKEPAHLFLLQTGGDDRGGFVSRFHTLMMFAGGTSSNAERDV